MSGATLLPALSHPGMPPRCTEEAAGLAFPLSPPASPPGNPGCLSCGPHKSRSSRSPDQQPGDRDTGQCGSPGIRDPTVVNSLPSPCYASAECSRKPCQAPQGHRCSLQASSRCHRQNSKHTLRESQLLRSVVSFLPN